MSAKEVAKGHLGRLAPNTMFSFLEADLKLFVISTVNQFSANNDALLLFYQYHLFSQIHPDMTNNNQIYPPALREYLLPQFLSTIQSPISLKYEKGNITLLILA